MIQQNRTHSDEDLKENYFELQKSFLQYKQHSIIEKQAMKKEIQKCRQQLQKFMSKMDKRVDSRISEERLLSNQQRESQQELHCQQISNVKVLLGNKQRMIQEMRLYVRGLQLQKKELVEHNTKMLVEISQSFESKEQKAQFKNSSPSKELLKMYQYLIEENNQLKKEIYLLRTNHINQSFHIHENAPISLEHKHIHHSNTLSSKSKPENTPNHTLKPKNRKNKPKINNK